MPKRMKTRNLMGFLLLFAVVLVFVTGVRVLRTMEGSGEASAVTEETTAGPAPGGVISESGSVKEAAEIPLEKTDDGRVAEADDWQVSDGTLYGVYADGIILQLSDGSQRQFMITSDTAIENNLLPGQPLSVYCREDGTAVLIK